AKAEGIVFVLLHLEDADGKTISRNAYWMQPHHDYRMLSQMKPAQLSVKVLHSTKEKNTHKYTIVFTNTSSELAFFVNPQLMINDEEVTPSFWSNNYFSLTANESITVTLSCPVEKLDHKEPRLVSSGWNVVEKSTDLT